MRMRRLLGLGVLVVLIGGGALVAFVFRDRLSSNASDINIGECVETPALGEFTDLQHRPCTEPHDGEIFLKANYPDQATLPSDPEFQTFFKNTCLGSAFTTYTGVSYDASQDIDAGYFTPTAKSWPDGDREVICYLTPAAGGTISKSYKAG